MSEYKDVTTEYHDVSSVCTPVYKMLPLHIKVIPNLIHKKFALKVAIGFN